MEKKNEFCLQEIKGRKAVTCIETHTEGEPTRTILSGFPEIPGEYDGRKDALYDAGTGLAEKSNLF